MQAPPDTKVNHKELGSLRFTAMLEELPPLPKVIRYHDDYAEKVRTITNPDSDRWEWKVDGKTITLSWEDSSVDLLHFFKSFTVWAISRYDSTTIPILLPIDRCVSREMLENFSCSVEEARIYWESHVLSQSLSPHSLTVIKAVLRFMCDCSLGPWSPDYLEYLKTWTFGGTENKSSFGVLSGESILSSAEQGKLIDFFDDLNTEIKTGRKFNVERLRSACILYWSYQHAFRPMQIASLNLENVIIRTYQDETPMVHAVFHRIKQRSSAKKIPMRRKVKRDWAWMMKEFALLRKTDQGFQNTLDRPNSFFGLPPQDVGTTIMGMTKEITGIRRNGTQMRHSAAQRLADAGASQLDIAEYLGHSDVTTSGVYFEASPTQADRVNKALGLSPIYSKLAKIARMSKDKIIDWDTMVGLDEDKQIGAVPHGIPIAGIGGCGYGLSGCTKTPAISCYLCNKFLPLDDADVHRGVQEELRGVVQQFIEAGKGDRSNPAFMQFRDTLEAINALIDLLEGKDE